MSFKIIEALTCFAAFSFSVNSHALPIFYHKKVSQGFLLAEHTLNRALQNSNLLEEFKVLEAASKIEVNFQKLKRKSRSTILNPTTSCTHWQGKQIYGLARGETILLCPLVLKLSVSDIAQSLLHESVHAIGIKDECFATKLELTISILGGLDPFISSYVNWDNRKEPFCSADGAAFELGWTRWFAHATGITSHSDMSGWILRTFSRQAPSKKFEAQKEEIAKVINKQSLTGKTALMEAAERGDYDWVNLLLGASGIEVGLKSNEGLTAEEYANRNDHKSLGRLISNFKP